MSFTHLREAVLLRAGAEVAEAGGAGDGVALLAHQALRDTRGGAEALSGQRGHVGQCAALVCVAEFDSSISDSSDSRPPWCIWATPPRKRTAQVITIP